MNPLTTNRANGEEAELSSEDISRYARQLVLPCFGVEAQKRVKSSSILIIGAGGLGCPAAMYLAGSGIGRLGILDRGDTVERSNLHRQIAHREQSVGVDKAESLRTAVLALNPTIQVDAMSCGLHAHNAEEIVSLYDVVLDCSDNVITRYIVNDACVMMNKPLVSGSAIGLEGQLTVYFVSKTSKVPCYRCIFPVATPKSCVGSCDSAGVLGPVPGLIGTLQAMEALKLVSQFHGSQVLAQRMLLYDSAECAFRVIKLRPRSKSCLVCSVWNHANAEASANGVTQNVECSSTSSNPFKVKEYDYESFISVGDSGMPKPTLSSKQRIAPSEFSSIHISSRVLVDVRPQEQYAMCSLPNSVNIPLKELSSRLDEVEQLLAALPEDQKAAELDLDDSHEMLSTRLFVVCRRGNESQKGVYLLEQAGYIHVRDVIGGLAGWTDAVDPKFPKY